MYNVVVPGGGEVLWCFLIANVAINVLHDLVFTVGISNLVPTY